MTEKFTPILNKMKTMKKNVKMISCDNTDEKKNIEENCAENPNEINFEFTSPEPPHKNG